MILNLAKWFRRRLLLKKNVMDGGQRLITIAHLEPGELKHFLTCVQLNKIEIVFMLMPPTICLSIGWCSVLRNKRALDRSPEWSHKMVYWPVAKEIPFNSSGGDMLFN